MFDLLVYLFEYHQSEDDSNNAVNSKAMTDELEGAGFTREEIDGAFGWLESLVGQGENDLPKFVVKGVRPFSQKEKTLLTLDVRSFLLNMRESGVLDAYSFELIVDRLLALDIKEIEIEHVRWVSLMVLCNHSEYADLVDWAESKMSGSLYNFH